MKSKKISRKELIPSLISLLLAAGVATVFHACDIKEDGSWMHCHDAQLLVFRWGIVLTLLLLCAALFNGKTIKILLYAAAAAASVYIFLIPGTIVSMCLLQTMRCWAVMQPFVRIMSVLTAAASIFFVVRLIRSK